jgi:hypothetical protein
MKNSNDLEQLREMAQEAFDDGDTLAEFKSTLTSHLIYLVQAGKFKPERELGDYAAEASKVWPSS